MTKPQTLLFVAPAIAVVVVWVRFFGFSDRDLWDSQDGSLSMGQINTSSGSSVWYTDEGDTLEDIWLSGSYTSPWFADIDMIAGQWVALIDQGDNYFVRQKQCRMAEEWENRLSIFTTDVIANNKSPWYIRFMDRKAQEYRIHDFRYDGDDHSRFIIVANDRDALQNQTHFSRFWLYRDSPEIIQLRDESGNVTWYSSEELKDDYSVSECVQDE